jgi:REP element-mobilizing transposase RayT
VRGFFWRDLHVNYFQPIGNTNREYRVGATHASPALAFFYDSAKRINWPQTCQGEACLAPTSAGDDLTYNPDIHHRNSVRLRSYDYRSAGAYFVTICTFQKEAILGEIVDEAASLSSWGNEVKECWQQIPGHFPNVDLDEFIIMPNHLHGIVFINDSVGATHASPALTAVTDLADVSITAPDNRARHASPLQKPGERAERSRYGCRKSARV